VAVVLLTLSVPLSAQHGGHASGGGHGGFAGHSSSHAFSGSHSASAFGAHSLGPGSSFRGPLTSRGFNRGFRRSGAGVRIRSRRFRNNCFSGFGCGWGYGYPYLGGGVDPYWWSDSDSSYDQDQQYEMSNEMNGQSPEQQRMRATADPYVYSRPAPAPQREASNEALPDTVLVFRDQHKQEVQNYAIVGQTLWNFAPQHTQKISLADLDLPATTKANDERGVDFRLPGAHEGQ